MASEERSTQDIAQPRRTTSTSTKQPSLATMPIKDADQSNKNHQVAAELNMLRQLSINDNIQSPKKSVEETPGRVDPIPANIIARGATGNKLTSGFSAPAFGQTVTPIKNSSFNSGRNSKFDNISSNEPSFGALAKSGGTAFGNSQTSNPSIGAFGSGIPSDDGNYENPKQRGDESLGQEHPLGFVDTSLDELTAN